MEVEMKCKNRVRRKNKFFKKRWIILQLYFIILLFSNIQPMYVMANEDDDNISENYG